MALEIVQFPSKRVQDCKWENPTRSKYCFSVLKIYPSFEAYFHIVQKHLPLVSRASFFRVLKQSPEKHQILALKYAVCMAGAQAESVAFQLKEQYYTAARHHLEQAELVSDASSFWNIEAAQALVLVTRFEYEHFAYPRAKITLSRLSALMSILGRQDISRSDKRQDLVVEELSQRRMISLINLSIRFQEMCLAGNTYSKVSCLEAIHSVNSTLNPSPSRAPYFIKKLYIYIQPFPFS